MHCCITWMRKDARVADVFSRPSACRTESAHLLSPEHLEVYQSFTSVLQGRLQGVHPAMQVQRYSAGGAGWHTHSAASVASGQSWA